MKLIKKVNILIVGLGLLGGSYAKGLKKLGFDELYEKIKNGDRDGMREMMRLSTTRRKLFDRK